MIGSRFKRRECLVSDGDNPDRRTFACFLKNQGASVKAVVGIISLLPPGLIQ